LLLVDFILFLFFYFDVLIILNNVKIKVDERTQSGLEVVLISKDDQSQTVCPHFFIRS
jgi:hypothetical protein